jgi:hypothetical protein
MSPEYGICRYTFLDGRLSVGIGYTCMVRTDGTVACWGSHDNGKTTPPSGTFLQVSAGFDYTCGVRTDGTLSCWGEREAPPSGIFLQVSVGSHSGGYPNNYACGLRTDGTVACWGSYVR